jgi:protoporphyrinogen oxidase
MSAAPARTEVAILGTGMAALGAAHRLAAHALAFSVFDKADHIGGHTATYPAPGGFLFDDGPHVSFTKDERIQAILAEQLDGRYETVQMFVDNYWHGHLMKHPAQNNLHGLPTELIVEIIRDFAAVHAAPAGPIGDYAGWLEAAYGTTFARMFPSVYGLKYHTIPPDQMTTEWLGPRMYRPSLDEVLRGALEASTADVHYVTHFRYPAEGGFESYLRPFWTKHPPLLGHELTGFDPVGRILRFAGGSSIQASEVISSIALTDLVPLIDGVPPEVLAAAGRLAFTTALVVDVGVDRADLSTAHLRYFYDEDIVFARLNFPHMLSAQTAPPGMGSVQAEIYFSDKYRPLAEPIEALVERTVADLRRVGILRPGDQLLVRRGRLVRHANVIYDKDRAAALAVVHDWLDGIGLHYCGRYGDWDHSWTDEAFASGERAAQKVLAGR